MTSSTGLLGDSLRKVADGTRLLRGTIQELVILQSNIVGMQLYKTAPEEALNSLLQKYSSCSMQLSRLSSELDSVLLCHTVPVPASDIKSMMNCISTPLPDLLATRPSKSVEDEEQLLIASVVEQRKQQLERESEFSRTSQEEQFLMKKENVPLVEQIINHNSLCNSALHMFEKRYVELGLQKKKRNIINSNKRSRNEFESNTTSSIS